jgi:ankyrin repeat protein
MVDEMISHCKKGSVDSVRSYLLKNVDINSQDKEGKGLLHHAVINNKRKMLGFLLKQDPDAEEVEIEINLQDNDGNSALHLACDLELKELIICLLLHKADYLLKNNKDELPGKNSPDISLFLSNITDEEKCFGILDAANLKKLTAIFNDIDYDKTKKINLKKAVSFNHFIGTGLNSNALLLDA